MQINRISRLRNCGIFRNFTWSKDLHEFGQFNLIYGRNGTGKTTISRILRDLERKQVPTGADVKLLVDGREIAAPAFPSGSVPIRVFNRDFIEDSVFPFGGGEAPPIFVIGTASVAKQQRVSRLKSALMRAQSALQAEHVKKRNAEKDLDEYCVQGGRTIKNLLRSSGANRFSSYNKRNYRSRSEAMLASGDRAFHQLSEEQRAAFRSQHAATPKKKISGTAYRFPDLDALAGTVSGLLSSAVASEYNQSLKDDRTLSKWVREGLILCRHQNEARCPFCEQVIPSERLDALEKHFNAEYEHLLGRIDSTIDEIRLALEYASAFELPNPAQLHDDLATAYEDALVDVEQTRNATRRFFNALLQSLEEKKSEPFAPVPLEMSVPLIDYGSIERLNAVIQQHNQACDAHELRAEQARERLEADFVADGLLEFQRLRAEVEEYDESLDGIAANVKRQIEQIDDLEREIVEHRRPAEELNDDLSQYFGHSEVHLEIKDTGYTIARDGVPATELSEGETTAIALLYFLKSLEDRRFDLENGIVVLDDPVSSLDSHALDLAFGLIQERAGSSGQLLILSHNSTFSRLVYNWFHNLPVQRGLDFEERPARFYEISCAQEEQQRCASIRRLHPLLV